MKFEDALKELKAGNCEGIVPEDFRARGQYVINTDGVFQYSLRHKDYANVCLDVNSFLGEWKLINPVIRPKPGEVWVDGNNLECFITQTQVGLSEGRPQFRAWQDGTWGQVTFDMIDGKNGWKRIYSPGDGGKS